jgi:hypothetical protein
LVTGVCLASSPFFSLVINASPNGTSQVPRSWEATEDVHMNSVIYLIGLIVVVLAILSFLGLH